MWSSTSGGVVSWGGANFIPVVIGPDYIRMFKLLLKHGTFLQFLKGGKANHFFFYCCCESFHQFLIHGFKPLPLQVDQKKVGPMDQIFIGLHRLVAYQPAALLEH